MLASEAFQELMSSSSNQVHPEEVLRQVTVNGFGASNLSLNFKRGTELSNSALRCNLFLV